MTFDIVIPITFLFFCSCIIIMCIIFTQLCQGGGGNQDFINFGGGGGVLN